MRGRSSPIKDIEQHLSNAAQLLSKGEYEGALRELHDAHEIASEFISVRRADRQLKELWLSILTSLVRALSALQRYEEALTYANTACANFRRNPFCNLLRAQILASLERRDEAIMDVKRAMRGYRDDAGAMLRLAKIAFEVREYALAKECCMIALAKNDTLPEAYLLLSEILRRIGKREEALSIIIKALSKGVADVELKLKAAELYHEFGELGKAVEILESAAAETDDESINIVLSELYMELGNYSRVVECCSKALRHSPDEPLLLDMLAFAHLQMGNLDEAIQALTRLVHIAPMDTFTRFRLATLYHQKGAYASAMREYQRVLSMEPNGIFAEPAKAAIQQLDEIQLEQVFMLSAEDPVFRVKLMRDPAKTLRERGFYLTEASIEMLKNVDLMSKRKERNMRPA
ncbi:MAG: tetratricopeptide repeat protein [Armatimonadota bacterium]|nr:tetratricopeptide repeat protein [Armatimonadota bacterium]MCX7776474.1 tetratricopeptide repeat protein [Armatimonadota bacterium]MDW8024271.1 tetratricopeptide repeat protein [Armatimonadota bacterium]